jgi:hypothetical protein
MAVRLDTDIRNVIATAMAAGFPAGATVQIRTGSQPASANTTASGTLLATITLPASPWATAASGSVAKQGTWSATAVATGTAGYARLINGANAIDVSVGVSATDWIIDNASILNGGTVTIVTAALTAPSGEAA